MSSSEGEDFNFQDDSGSESEGFVPAPKKTTKAAPKVKAAPAKPKATTTKAPAKPKAAPKKKVLADHNSDDERSVEVDADPDVSIVSEAPAASATGPANKKKTASEKYTKLSHLEHILQRPDTYIGSVETITQQLWVYDSETKGMSLREIAYVPGFYKIVDEILVNAADNKMNDPNMDTIKVTIDPEENLISVYNTGRGIPIEMHSKEKMYIPELIFGNLLAGSNFDDTEKKLVGGRNGFGAKLANIYSHEFTLETADKNSGQKYKQTWTNNMRNCGKPKITKNSRGEEWTRVTFKPDLARFGMDRIDEDVAALLKRRVFDLAGVVKDVKVFLNDERLKVKNFKQYVEMYVKSAKAEAADASGGAAQPNTQIFHEKISDRWEVAFAVSDGTFQHVSFANSIATSKGGTHVNLIADQIAKNLISFIEKKNKAAKVKAPQIKNHMWVFVNSTIENPTFDSQTKEQLTLPASKFGSKPTVTEDFLKKVQKSSIIESILDWAKFKADQQIKKTDGTKRTRLTGLPKLSDANNAGTKEGKNCTLILTEGDSAKALAVAGLSVVGRDNFGVFPLRGKLLNVREARHDQIMKNEEIQNIKKILGLQHNKTYTDREGLRYGQVMIMADQDHDGSHIKGLIINFLDHFYPSLLKLPEFLVEFVTPIVRVTKGKDKKNFFTLPEFEQWLEDTPNSHLWTSKYYKGLGTSKSEDARDYFSHMARHMIPFATTQEGDRELIDLAFSKKKADDRKEWLRQLKPGTYLDHRLEEIPYSEFINKELILFSMADNIRSIPSVADGFKPGQRKVIWACFKRKLKKEVKVAQLVGYISEHAAYHHGEQSLMATIVNLAQDYVGANNLNLLKPNGQYGTRDAGGKDHASARYIFTELQPITRTIFHPADDHLLMQQTEDNQVIEPQFYMPTVPMVLINGAEGIGTGWSTNIPPYNPTDVVTNLRRLMNDEPLEPMQPWYRGFNGEIIQTDKSGKYDIIGKVIKIDDTSVQITELPVHMWTKNFKAQLETMMVSEKGETPPVKNYQEHHANEDVNFLIQMNPKDMKIAEEQGFVDYFKLRSKLSTGNMICFDLDGKIKKYDTPEGMLEDFYPKRLAYYQKRKDFMAGELQFDLDRLNNQARFVQMIINKELNVSNRKKVDIVADLRKHQFKPIPKKKAKAQGETEELADDEEDQAEAEDELSSASGNTSDFDYLLSMAIYTLTRERFEKLRQQASDKEAELLVLLEKSPKQLWNTDLDIFLKEWEEMQLAHEDKIRAGKINKKNRGKKLKTRKSIGSKRKDSDEDEDFKPIKAPLKRKPAIPKALGKSKDEDDDEKPARPTGTAAAQRKASGTVAKGKKKADDDVDDEEEKPKKRAASKKALKIDSDSESVFGAPSKPASKSKPKVATMDVDSDIEMDDVPAPPPAKRAAATKAKPMVIDDSDEEMEAPSNVKGKGKATAKRKSLEAEESDDELLDKPAKKAKQSDVRDFFNKPTAGSSKPAAGTQRKISQSMKRSPKSKKAPAKKVVESDSDDDFDTLPKPKAAPARAGTARAARGAQKKYVDISDDDDGQNDASSFADDD